MRAMMNHFKRRPRYRTRTFPLGVRIVIWLGLIGIVCWTAYACVQWNI